MPSTAEGVAKELKRPDLPDTLRVLYLCQLSQYQQNISLPAATQSATQALALARRYGYVAGQLAAQYQVGNCYYYQGDAVLARRAYEALLVLARRHQRHQAQGNAYLGMGRVAYHVNDTLHQPLYCARALAIYQSCKPPYRVGQAQVFNLMGKFYRYTHQAAYHAQGTARTTNNSDTPSEQAKQMFRKVLAMPPAGLAAERADALSCLGQEYDLAGQSTLAQQYYAQARALAPLHSPLWLTATIYNAQSCLFLEQPRQALLLAQQVRQVARRAGNRLMAQNGLLVAAEAMQELRMRGSFDSLVVYLSESAASMQAEQTAAMSTAEAKFHTREQQAQIHALQQDRRLATQTQELARLRTRQERVGLGVLVGLALLLGGSLFARYRRRQAAARAADAAALRQRLAADLHDDVGNLLTQITMQSSLLSSTALRPDQLLAHLNQLTATSRQAAQQMADVVWGLNQTSQSLPELLDRMRDHAHEVCFPLGIEVDFEASPAVADTTLTLETLHNLYLIYKEALHNVVKHAQATRVTVRLDHSPTGLRLEVSDNGQGHDGSPRPDGNGLRNMQARAQAVGGAVQYETLPTGFGVVVQLPAAVAA